MILVLLAALGAALLAFGVIAVLGVLFVDNCLDLGSEALGTTPFIVAAATVAGVTAGIAVAITA